ncbi:MAG: hypothetical protein SF052_08110 [Bacteroidia bacterium]|nr:hypothetical protein [Bacteroidia bacterium]
MFKFFKNSSNGNSKKPAIPFVDINGVPLAEGDKVESLRYNLGQCIIVSAETGYVYESLETGEQVSYLKMVDAATTFQKVKKL